MHAEMRAANVIFRVRMTNTVGATQIAHLWQQFEERLRAIKAGIQPRDFEWYPYDSFSIIPLFQPLLSRAPGGLLDLIGDAPVADIGCADGDLAFFLESLGCRVDAIDNGRTNYNDLKGIRALKRSLKSPVEIHEMDLDSQFTLPREQYGLVLFLGILYHLKNPYYALEKLARGSRYCLLSTRIAKFAPDGRTDLENVAVAYLLDDRETNDDSTNYWIFSDAGLRRILDRTGWTVLSYIKAGSSASEPVSLGADERVFCFLESRYTTQFGSNSEFLLLQGWHSVEEGGWRWTDRRFSVLLRPKNPDARTLRLSVAVLDIMLHNRRSLTLSAKVNGVPLPPETFTRTGRCVYTRVLPDAAGARGEYLVEFELDGAIPPAGLEERELGLIVSSVGI